MQNLFPSCHEKQKKILALFDKCLTPEDRYQKIIEIGKHLPPFPLSQKVEENLVKGCQSIVYLFSELNKDKLSFVVFSEALISKGLAALLILFYENEAPEVVLKCKPAFLDTLQINASLTPGRSNGLASIYLKMQQDALKFLVGQKKLF